MPRQRSTGLVGFWMPGRFRSRNATNTARTLIQQPNHKLPIPNRFLTRPLQPPLFSTPG